MRKLGDGARAAITRSMEVALDAGMKEAIKRSAGPYSSAALAEMDHPFARRHGSPGLDPSIINVQTGMFVSNWSRSPVFESAGSYYAFIVNRTPYADFLVKGTKFMFERPIVDPIEKRMAQVLEREITARLSRLAA